MRFTRWDQLADSDFSNQVLLHILAPWHLSQCSDSEQKAAVSELVKSEDIRSLCLFDLSYKGLHHQDFYHLSQILAFFKKRKDLDIGIDTEAAAWSEFKKTEALCFETNTLFRSYNQNGFFFPPDVEAVLFRAQRKICSILGDVPSLDSLRFHFGPGATTQVKKKDASARRKLSQMFCCSEDSLRFLPEVLESVPVWSGVNPDPDIATIVPVAITSGKINFVLKNAKTKRTIGVEPMLNSFVQLGIGSYIAGRLRQVDVDISDQTRNQRMAREGSITNALATLDLRSASGTIATGFVESLLPYEWWDFLRAFRTSEVSTPDGILRLSQFSSMGNGFTFPLQTLIFFALASSCCNPKDRDQISVYGDDIIIPTYGVPLMKRVLTSCGFILNEEKSYWDGPFRESCGKDYVSGIDVRPCFIKDTLSGSSCMIIHNFYVRTMQPEPAALILNLIDESLRLWGPDGYGDGHLIGDPKLTPYGRENGWGGFTFETFTWKSVKGFYALGADYVFPSYSIYMKEGPFEDPSFDVALSKVRRRPSRILGALRPERSDSVYVKKNGKVFLQDVLPGRNGYKRIKIYISNSGS